MPEIVLKMLLGTTVGAMFGLLLARAKLCSAQTCHAKANLVFSIIAGAFFGAAVAWYWMQR